MQPCRLADEVVELYVIRTCSGVERLVTTFIRHTNGMAPARTHPTMQSRPRFSLFFRLAIPRWITAVITAEMQRPGMFARETMQRGSGLASEKVLQHPKARSPSPACHLLWTSSHAFDACMSKLVLGFVVASATPAGVVNVCHLRSFWVSYAFFLVMPCLANTGVRRYGVLHSSHAGQFFER